MKKKLNIIYEDKYLIVVLKPAGMYSISKDGGFSKNLYSDVREYIKRKNPNNKIFIVHRLDKETSGLMIFAKSEKVKFVLQNNWSNVKRTYVAVVEGKLKIKKNKLVNYLKEDKNMNVYITHDKKHGKEAITNYEVIRENTKYSLLNIMIETGRKNQIRVQLSNIGHPIVGDKKYGAVSNPIKRMSLHAIGLEFKHPILGNNILLNTGIPESFEKIVN